MRHIFVVIFIALFVTPVLFAQNIEEHETRTAFRVDDIAYVVNNGKAWQNFDKHERILYLNGIEEGIRLFLLDAARNEAIQIKEVAKKAERRLSISGFRFSDLVQQVDKFYLDSANLRVPVIEAYAYVIKRMKGESPQTLSEIEAALRKTYNK